MLIRITEENFKVNLKECLDNNWKVGFENNETNIISIGSVKEDSNFDGGFNIKGLTVYEIFKNYHDFMVINNDRCICGGIICRCDKS